MSKVVKNVVSAVGKVFGVSPNSDADAIRQASETQAAATREAAEKSAAAQREAAAQQERQLQQQAAAAAAARAAAVNQAQVANNQAALAQEQAQSADPTTPDVSLETQADANDPRRKYQGGSSSIGGSAGGAGIRL